MNKVDFAFVETRLVYVTETGLLFWKPKPAALRTDRIWNTRYANKEAGTLDGYGYRCININGRGYRSHRLAWLLYYGDWPKHDLDHINGNRLDNRIENLRDVTKLDNNKNCKLSKNNTSGFQGVRRHGRGWRADILCNYARVYLGIFDTPEDASRAYQAKALELGFHSNHGKTPT